MENYATQEASTSAEKEKTMATASLVAKTVEKTSTLDELARLQERAVQCGFLDGDMRAMLHKLRSEINELETALDNNNAEAREHEVADVIFNALMLARLSERGAQAIVDEACRKFAYRFGYVAAGMARQGKPMRAENVDAMRVLWREAKTSEESLTHTPARPQLVSVSE